jgi:hypothetical protein
MVGQETLSASVAAFPEYVGSFLQPFIDTWWDSFFQVNSMPDAYSKKLTELSKMKAR